MYVTIVGLMFYLSTFASIPPQMKDKIVVGRDTLLMDRPLPLSSDNASGYKLPEELLTYFNCNRGYYSLWKIDKDSLFLIKVNYCSEALEPEEAPKEFRRFAKWINQNIYIGRGKAIKYIDRQWIYPSELKIQVANGEVVDSLIVDNHNYLSPYTESNDILQNFLIKNIRWDSIATVPKSELNYTLAFELTIDSNGKVIGIETKRGHSEVLENEALRVIKEVPQWSVYYKYGKHMDIRYMIPINFAKLKNKSI